jgi:protein TonB
MPMPMPTPALAQAPRDLLQDWTPESLPAEDDFAQVAAQARLGVQRKADDESSRLLRQRLLVGGGIGVVVIGLLVFLVQKFYDPEARAREKAIAQEVSRMAAQQKVTDNLTLIEVDIENAIMNNDFDAARAGVDRLAAQSPDHQRLEFLRKSIDRAVELQKLAGQPPAQAQVKAAPTAPSRSVAAKPRPAERAPSRSKPESVATNTSRKSRDASPPRNSGANPPATRAYGAPIGAPLQAKVIPRDAPINTPPANSPSPAATPAIRSDTFGGRTVEASDSSAGQSTAVPAPGSSAASGSAAVAMPAAAPAQAPPPPAVDVVPAKILKRVTPVVTTDVPRKTKGFVVVKFEIGENGRVSNVAVLESTPAGVFDDAATTAVRKWVYEPRKENGVPVVSQSKARLIFDEAD